MPISYRNIIKRTRILILSAATILLASSASLRGSPCLHLGCHELLAKVACAQSPGIQGKNDGASTRKKRPKGKLSRTRSLTKSSASATKGAPKDRTTRPATKSTTPSSRASGTTGTAGDGPAGSQNKGLIGEVVQFIIKNKYWIIGTLVTGLVGSLIFLFISGQRRKVEELEDEPAELMTPQHRAFPTEEDEGPRRVLVDSVTGKPRTIPRRDDGEYALVVDEEELHVAHEGSSSGEYERVVLKVQELVEERNFEDAYEKYLERVETRKLAAFNPALERRLGQYFLAKNDYSKASKILEHHVATQPATEIEPEIYFDLGYIHFKEKTFDRSRHFFQLFAEKERNPVFTDRARRLIESLDRAEQH